MNDEEHFEIVKLVNCFKILTLISENKPSSTASRLEKSIALSNGHAFIQLTRRNLTGKVSIGQSEQLSNFIDVLFKCSIDSSITFC